MMPSSRDLFAATRERVDPRGSVCGPEFPVEAFRVRLPGWQYDFAELELAQAADGRWMWGVSYVWKGRGGGFRVGPKWGKFAADRESAAAEALAEIARDLPGVPPSRLRELAALVTGAA